MSTVGAATMLTSDKRTASDSVDVRVGPLVSGTGGRAPPSRVDMLNGESCRGSESDESNTFSFSRLLSSSTNVVHIAWIVLTSNRCTTNLTTEEPVFASMVTMWNISGINNCD